MTTRKPTAKSEGKPSRKRGRPPFEPTERQRGQVEAYRIAGYTEAQVAEYLDIDPKTLRAHFAAELDLSKPRVLAAIAGNVVRMAMGAPAQYDEHNNKIRDEVKPEFGPCCFFLKTQGKEEGWSERNELTGPNGRALFENFDPKSLNANEWATLKALLAKSGLNIPNSG